MVFGFYRLPLSVTKNDAESTDFEESSANNFSFEN